MMTTKLTAMPRLRQFTRSACFSVLTGAAALSGVALTVVAPVVHAAEIPAAASVGFEGLSDNAVVTSPFVVKFAATGIDTRPAGDPAPHSGHHHLLINHGPMPAGQVIPADDTHLHFGKAQTETALTLPPGKYMLTLQFGDFAHRSLGPALSKTIHITVK